LFHPSSSARTFSCVPMLSWRLCSPSFPSRFTTPRWVWMRCKCFPSVKRQQGSDQGEQGALGRAPATGCTRNRLTGGWTCWNLINAWYAAGKHAFGYNHHLPGHICMMRTQAALACVCTRCRHEMLLASVPEIQRTNLANVVLLLKSLNVSATQALLLFLSSPSCCCVAASAEFLSVSICADLHTLTLVSQLPMHASQCKECITDCVPSSTK